ncbi:class II fructose-bisphosphate aldolase [Devosia rhodophyticola]|uniref:Class II fructose-bisphosphate aldolase n=1 Tax=Devosia rhodophyticola TaxID=3026423 RepID=A0ABY7YV18_9HYPH|nr:class II fructose-bisphosphate aldolase [Devosia rhodophyticola]WDR04779.1 class II fructose-bisphosphate aldolase [Devosia rhodophyticola]
MSLVTLGDVLMPARDRGYAVAGVVVLGWEDARAYVNAAEAEGLPVILQAGPGCRAHTPLPVLAAMFKALAQNASVPVVAHLDHGASLEECRAAIECGFSSVMFDGSRLPLQQNIAETRAVADMAHAARVSCEGEIGFVGYADGDASASTSTVDAARFAAQTGVDALAISVGNVHLQKVQMATINVGAVRAIEAATAVPLVIHGGSGVPGDMRQFLARNTNVSKFNIGTELRMMFGAALRKSLAAEPDLFDRIALLKAVEVPIMDATRAVLRQIGPASGER